MATVGDSHDESHLHKVIELIWGFVKLSLFVNSYLSLRSGPISTFKLSMQQHADILPVSVQWTIGMNQHFSVTILPTIEFHVGFGCLVDTDLVGDHKAWLCDPGNDHVAEISVVHLDVALASANRKSLSKSASSFLAFRM